MRAKASSRSPSVLPPPPPPPPGVPRSDAAAARARETIDRFSDASPRAVVAVLGDLHLKARERGSGENTINAVRTPPPSDPAMTPPPPPTQAAEEPLFRAARDDLSRALRELGGVADAEADDSASAARRVVQLGDLGTSGEAGGPGTPGAFARARSYLSTFGASKEAQRAWPEDGDTFPADRPGSIDDLVRAADLGEAVERDCLAVSAHPFLLVTGNHDLEGACFPTDAENLDAWSACFGGRPHCWAADLGPAVAVGLSTVRFRSNTGSHHQVTVDAAQLRYLDEARAAMGSDGWCASAGIRRWSGVPPDPDSPRPPTLPPTPLPGGRRCAPPPRRRLQPRSSPWVRSQGGARPPRAESVLLAQPR